MTRLERLQAKLAEIRRQGGDGEIVTAPGLRPFILYTMAPDPRQAATNFFVDEPVQQTPIQ